MREAFLQLSPEEQADILQTCAAKFVLFTVGQANKQERAQILEAIFDLSHQEIVKRVQAGALDKVALAAHEYVYDIFPASEGKQRSHASGLGTR